MSLSHVNPILTALHAMQEHATPGVVTFLSEGADLGTYCEICDLDIAAHMVALWSFDAGSILHIAVGNVTSVEMAPVIGWPV